MRTVTSLAAASAVALVAGGCSSDQPKAAPPTPGLVEVVANGLTFNAPDTIPSGWVTFRFRNEAPFTHFAVLERLPDGIGLEQQQREVAPAFQAGMDRLAAGDAAGAGAAFGKLPPWFGKVVFDGGPGLTAPGHVSETTVNLTPGTYLLECYVKTAGTFHSFNRDPTAHGMVHQFTVTDAGSGAPEPTADLQVTVSGDSGIVMAGDPQAGRRTIAVHFADQAVYENFVGHDVHLVRLQDSTDLGALEAWMDWRRPEGLNTPSPAEFLGGTNEMPAGSTAYLRVTLDPGRYAWVAEVPDARAKGMLKPFTVPAAPASSSATAKPPGR